jgi:integral membrane protein
MHRTAVRLFVLAAIAEAISWLALLVGMAVKYGPPGNEIGVQIFGPVHGGLFVAYVALVLLVGRLRRWSWLTVGVALLCAVPPFATVAFERWASRRGLLAVPVDGPAASAGADPVLEGTARR